MDPIQMLRNRCAVHEQKVVAAQLGVSRTYLNDVLQGRRKPGKKILDALGLERVTAYQSRRKNGR
jgi:DNA-binding transcriptional regulator YdaS (Cro superfamily)